MNLAYGRYFHRSILTKDLVFQKKREILQLTNSTN